MGTRPLFCGNLVLIFFLLLPSIVGPTLKTRVCLRAKIFRLSVETLVEVILVQRVNFLKSQTVFQVFPDY